MHKIYSRVDTDKLLHIIHRLDEINQDRVDVIDEDNFLQLAVLKMKHGKTFKPHYHIWKDAKRERVIAQESWVVIKGYVKCILYDIDGKIISEPILGPGDCSITLEGGHNFEILADNTVVYEFKTGPYEGIEMDKRFIDE